MPTELQQSQAASQGQPKIVHCSIYCSRARGAMSASKVKLVLLVASLSDSRSPGINRASLVSAAAFWRLGTGMVALLLPLPLLEPGTWKQRGAGQLQRGLP